MDDHANLIQQFQGIADTSEDRARFYLESANWELPLALSSFYDNPMAGETEGNDDMDIDLHPDPLVVTGSNQPSSIRSGAMPNSQPKSKPKSSRFGSIRDLEDNNVSDNEEEGQRYYAGGSEHSGELIVGPPRRKPTNDEIAKALMQEAKNHGAQPVDASSRDAGKSGDSKPKYFGGGGYKLGESQDASEFVPARGAHEEAPEAQPMNVVLRLWSNGFTVDDGPLREFKDPVNEEFLSSIKKGEIPRELLRNSRGGEVHVDMEDHRQEEYKAPKKKLQPFTGQGHMLGSPAPEFSSNSRQANVMSTSVDPPIVIDKSQPTTLLQIRLSSGRRIRQEFNQSHRISNIRSFVASQHPDSAARPFVFMTTFPNKELDDENLTLKEANLLNAVVVQKMI